VAKVHHFPKTKKNSPHQTQSPSHHCSILKSLERNQTKVLFKLLQKYTPEDNKQKRERLTQEAKLKAESNFMINGVEKTVEKTRPFNLKFGLNHVTKLV
jgi:hypothetical protein